MYITQLNVSNGLAGISSIGQKENIYKQTEYKIKTLPITSQYYVTVMSISAVNMTIQLNALNNQVCISRDVVKIKYP